MYRVRRVIRKTKRVSRTKYPDVETIRPFQSAYRSTFEDQPPFQINSVDQPPSQINAINQTPIEVAKVNRKPVTDYVSLAIKSAKSLNQKTSFDHIDKVAAGLFKFDVDPHLQITMPNAVAQEIFDWIITLSQQPIDEEEKLRLARKFIVSLAPVGFPVEKMEEEKMEDLKRAKFMERVLRDMYGEGNSVAYLAKRYCLSVESISNTLGIKLVEQESKSRSK